MRIAFYEKDITPPLGGYLQGYYRKHEAEDVLDTLHVRCAVFEKDGQAAAAVSIDVCLLPDDLHDTVTARIREYTGIPAENVLLSANHTHKGLPIGDSPELNAFGDEAFKDVVYRLIADCVTLAWRRLKEGKVYYAVGKAEGVSFCRNYERPDGTYVTWAREEGLKPMNRVDPEVPFLFVRDKENKPCGALVTFACHQDCVPGSLYSGDYSHVLADELKKVYGPDFITVFLPGACGDINHIDPKIRKMPPDTYQKIGRALAETVLEKAEDAAFVGDFVGVSKKRFPARRRMLTDEEYFRQIEQYAREQKMYTVRNLAYYHACMKNPDIFVWLQCFRIGDAMLYGYPGEVFVDFGRDLKKRSPASMNLVATLCNTYCGYIATRIAHDEKSRLYEKDLCFGACLEVETGYRINEALLDMAKELTEK